MRTPHLKYSKKKNQQQFSTSNASKGFEGQRLGAQILTWRSKVRRRRREASLARVPGNGKLACLRGAERGIGDRVSDGGGEEQWVLRERGGELAASRRGGWWIRSGVWTQAGSLDFNWACDSASARVLFAGPYT